MLYKNGYIPTYRYWIQFIFKKVLKKLYLGLYMFKFIEIQRLNEFFVTERKPAAHKIVISAGAGFLISITIIEVTFDGSLKRKVFYTKFRLFSTYIKLQQFLLLFPFF